MTGPGDAEQERIRRLPVIAELQRLHGQPVSPLDGRTVQVPGGATRIAWAWAAGGKNLYLCVDQDAGRAGQWRILAAGPAGHIDFTLAGGGTPGQDSIRAAAAAAGLAGGAPRPGGQTWFRVPAQVYVRAPGYREAAEFVLDRVYGPDSPPDLIAEAGPAEEQAGEQMAPIFRLYTLLAGADADSAAGTMITVEGHPGVRFTPGAWAALAALEFEAGQDGGHGD